MTTDNGAPDPAAVGAELRLVVGQFVRLVRADADEVAPRLAAVLGRLDRSGPQTIRELADADAVRHQSMAATVAEVEARGWVERRPHPTDGRMVLLSLTTAGRIVLDAGRQRRARWLADAIGSKLSRAEQRQLAQAIELVKRLIATGGPGDR